MSKSPVFIGLTNPKSPSNVGAVLRAAGCYQVNEVRYSGPRYTFAAKFNTDTRNIANKIPLLEKDSLLDDLAEEMHVICVDLVEGAIPLPDFEHPENAIYIFGPEDGTISQSVIDKADAVVYVPTVGCMNLAASVNVLLYDRLAKSSGYNYGDQLIKKSRDTNNKTKVKQHKSLK